METKNTQTNQITEGVIWKQLLFFFFPIAIGTLVQQFYNMADAAIVGRFVGKEALASVGGSASVLTSMVVYFFTGLASGAAVIVAQFYGAKDRNGLHKAIHTVYAFSIIISIGFAVLGWFITPPVLKMMNTPSDILNDSITYLRIYFIGLIATLTYNVGSSIMRAAGDSKRPLYYLIVCSVLNIVLDLIFIIVFKLGIAGAAIATVISQAVSALLVARSLMGSYDMVKLEPRKIRIYTDILATQLKIGLPSGLQTCLSGITNMILQTAINGFGTDTAAAWAAFNKIDMIFWTLCGAFGVSITTFVGQNYGAKKYDRMWKSVRICLKMALLVCGAAQFCLYFFCEPMYMVFTSDVSVIEIGVYMMQYLVPVYILFVFQEISAGALRGLGETIMPTVFNLCGSILIRVPWVLFILPRYYSLETIMLSYPVAGSFGLVCTIIYFYYKKQKLKMQILTEVAESR